MKVVKKPGTVLRIYVPKKDPLWFFVGSTCACDHCSAILKITASDIKRIKIHSWYPVDGGGGYRNYFIRCPECWRKITLGDVENTNGKWRVVSVDKMTEEDKRDFINDPFEGGPFLRKFMIRIFGFDRVVNWASEYP